MYLLDLVSITIDMTPKFMFQEKVDKEKPVVLCEINYWVKEKHRQKTYIVLSIFSSILVPVFGLYFFLTIQN